jgi:IS30 family transposase
MSNSLKVSLQTTIYSLDDRGWSRRRIARELGLDRETVSRYLRLAESATPPSGSEETDEAKPAISTTGNSVGRKSQCEPLAEVIKAEAELGLSAQRIYQDLVGENGFTNSYQSVKRFVRKLQEAQPTQQSTAHHLRFLEHRYLGSGVWNANPEKNSSRPFWTPDLGAFVIGFKFESIAESVHVFVLDPPNYDSFGIPKSVTCRSKWQSQW